MNQNAHILIQLLNPLHRTQVVDIGANPIDGTPPYAPLMQADIADITGFEPQEDAFANLQKMKGSHETYLPYAVGDGKEHTLHICVSSGMTSILKPDATTLSHFEILKQAGEVESTERIKTKKLDSIKEIQHIDLLKIDIQGFELEVFRNGKQKLHDAVAIQTEISFTCLYEKQPSFGDIDTELRAQGYIPHCFPAVKNWMISPLVVNNDPRQPLNHLLEADIVYVRDFIHPDKMSDEQLKQLALISHFCYSSFDLTLRCLTLLEARTAVENTAGQQYLNSLASQ